MAEIAPFRGLRYNLAKVPDLNVVVIPPYDVISPAQQETFHRISAYNMVHLELGEVSAEDTDDNNPHTRAARYLEQWQEQHIFLREAQPAIYHYALDYSVGKHIRKTRYGFICALRLEDFRSGCVRPHEKTFQAIKDERLQLMNACHANLSPVFAMYSDAAQVIDHYLQEARESDPVIDYQDSQGQHHRLWKVLDLKTLQQVRALMRDKPIFIADGHHRYETALAYRNLQRQKYPEAGERAAFEYIMVYLSNMNQTGLTILPTHRLLRHLEPWRPEQFIEQSAPFFDCLSFRNDGLPAGAAPAEWAAALGEAAADKQTCIGFYWQKARRVYLLKAKPQAIVAYLAAQQVPEVLQSLDVVILDRIILRHLLGLSETFLADENNIHFRHDLTEGLSQLQAGTYDAGFFINPTRIEQVQEVASAGLIMPHKSTYFYPKAFSGLVVNPLAPHEEIIW
jgi:uncharacterized protein (DUF1015 family)